MFYAKGRTDVGVHFGSLSWEGVLTFNYHIMPVLLSPLCDCEFSLFYAYSLVQLKFWKYRYNLLQPS